MLEIQRDTSGIDAVISQMHTTLQLVVAKRTGMQEYAQAHKVKISPLRRLPTEILGDIFINALPPFPCRLSNSEPPVLLELVNRQWKDVARSTPALWSRIDLDLQSNDVDRESAIVSTRLARSSQHPLWISLRAPALYKPSYRGHPALALIIEQCERWHIVHLNFLPIYIIEELAAVNGRLPVLEKLHVTTFGDEEEENSTPFDAFALAPKLRHLESNSDISRDIVTNKSLHLPWNDLTNLVIGLRRAADVLSILPQCHNLVRLQAHISNRPMAKSLDDVPPVHLAHLRSLFLTLPDFSTILPKLILPTLTQVSLTPLRARGPVAELWHTYSGFDTLLNQSGCTIRQLEIHDEWQRIKLRDLVGLLEVLPSVTELEVSEILSDMLPHIFADHENIKNTIGIHCNNTNII